MIGAYLVGEPGVGKSTTVRTLTQGIEREWRTRPFAHALYHGDGVRVVAAQIGGEHDQFPGTDRLSMSVQPKAIEWLEMAPAPVVFGEGDRLATTGFMDALSEWCDEWALVHLTTAPEVAATRRASRGSEQDETWLAGRRTKVSNLVAKYPERVVVIDASMPTEAVVAQIRRKVRAFDWTC